MFGNMKNVFLFVNRHTIDSTISNSTNKISIIQVLLQKIHRHMHLPWILVCTIQTWTNKIMKTNVAVELFSVFIEIDAVVFAAFFASFFSLQCFHETLQSRYCNRFFIYCNLYWVETVDDRRATATKQLNQTSLWGMLQEIPQHKKLHVAYCKTI